MKLIISPGTVARIDFISAFVPALGGTQSCDIWYNTKHTKEPET